MSEEGGKACPISEVIKEELVKYLPPAIGRGSYGTVYKGTYVKSGKETEVAVKKIDKESDDDINKQFEREISFYEQLKHPNIIYYHGTVITKASYLVVTEFACKGNLFEHLKKLRKGGTQLNQKLKLKWQIEAARSIQYLHGKGITHGDIKSPNFLITSDDTLKLCDFGNTKSTLATVKTNTQSTPQWQAPEMFIDGHYSSKGDIFALGVVVWELETCQEPYSGYKQYHIVQKIVAGEKLPIPLSVNERARQLISSCCKQDRNERPNIHSVVRELVMYTSEVSRVSEQDIHFVITNLGFSQLKELYIQLNISNATVSRREASIKDGDVDAKAREVLLGWKSNNGSKATRGAVLEALRKASLKGAEDMCRDEWDLPECRQQTKTNVSTVPGNDHKTSPKDTLRQPHKYADTSKRSLHQPQRLTDTGKKPPSENRQRQSTSWSEESSPKQTFKKRDRVRIKDLETKEMKRLQDGHGGYNKQFGMSRNQTGKVVREYFTGDVHVKLDSGISWTYNPECLTWISDGSGHSTEKGREINVMRKGSRVKIRNMDIDEMKRLQKHHGGYNPSMSLVRNGLGKVKKIDSDGDIVVKTDDGPKFAFNPACVELVADDAEHEWQDSLYKMGSGVRIIESIELEEMKKMQKEFGGWIPEMAYLRGKQGVICKVTLSRVFVKMQNGRIYAIDPSLLIPDDAARNVIQRGIRKGDRVRVKTMSVDHMKELQDGNGGWMPELQKMMNTLGHVHSVRLGRAATLKMDNGRKVCFNTECLDLVEPAPGPERNPWSDDSSDSSEDSSDDSDEGGLIGGLISSGDLLDLHMKLKPKLYEDNVYSNDTIKDKRDNYKGPRLLRQELVNGILTKSKNIVCSYLDPKPLLPIMETEDALTYDEAMLIKKETLVSDQSSKLIDILRRKPTKSYDVFMNALRAERIDLYNEIEEIENEFGYTRLMAGQSEKREAKKVPASSTSPKEVTTISKEVTLSSSTALEEVPTQTRSTMPKDIALSSSTAPEEVPTQTPRTIPKGIALSSSKVPEEVPTHTPSTIIKEVTLSSSTAPEEVGSQTLSALLWFMFFVIVVLVGVVLELIFRQA